jgi:NAD(P)-dependent dehydrogenase (short-subunit alcohol dehydrogenase family)
MSLINQRVVLLGGTSGIGLATAKLLASRGAEVIVVSSRDTTVKSALAELPASASGHALDLRSEHAVEGFFETIGSFDHLVYSAGESLTLAEVAAMDLDQARGFFTLRLFSAISAVKYALTSIRSDGSITLTTGSAGERPGAGWSIAASLCGAVTSLTKALALELAPIRVNAIAPGVVDSPLWAGMNDQARSAYFAAVGASLPLGRVGRVEEVALAYAYMIEQSFSTGTVLGIDGGALIS